MDIEKSVTLAAPAAQVWQLILDPQIMAGCVPGVDFGPASEGTTLPMSSSSIEVKMGSGADGSIHSPGAWGNTWADLAELEPAFPELWDRTAEALLVWCRRGVDGFRCDVASLVPLDFWREARRRVAAINPEVLWLAEHHFDGNCAYVDPVTFAAAVLAATKRIKVGFAVAQVSLHHPMRLAEQMSLLNNLGKGRVIVVEKLQGA